MNTEILEKVNAALATKSLNFKTEMAETFALIDGVYVPTGMFAPVRSDKSGEEALISGRSFTDRYVPVQNEDAFSVLGDMAEIAEVEFKNIGTWGNGAGIYAQVSLGDSMDIGSTGDKVGRYLSVVNSHDGSSSLQVLVTPYRFFCQNQISKAINEATRNHRIVSIRHDAHGQDRLKEIAVALRIADGMFASSEAAYQRLADRRITMEEAKEAMARMLPYPKVKEGEEITERTRNHWERAVINVVQTFKKADDGRLEVMTGWNLYNAIQGAHQHGVKKTAAYERSLIMGGIARQAEESLATVQDILFEGGMSKTHHPEFDEVFARIA